jgi:hypothetical protein
MGAHHLATVALVVLSYMLNVHLVGEYLHLPLGYRTCFALSMGCCACCTACAMMPTFFSQQPHSSCSLRANLHFTIDAHVLRAVHVQAWWCLARST